MKFTAPLVESYHGTKFSITIYRSLSGRGLRKCVHGCNDESPYFQDAVPLYRFNIRPKYSEARLAA